ncbi:MAG: hypothetical protein NTZ69_15790 [Bacteroidia bacterium]|nr:hypothetical protein [Bacteroidia bacterium]
MELNLIAETKKQNEWHKKWNKINSPVVSFNNKGIVFEKSGEVGKAIQEYEKCIEWIFDNFDGVYMKAIAWHSPDRLRVLYKKTGNPKEREFLIRFTNFCIVQNIDYPKIYDTQLEKK